MVEEHALSISSVFYLLNLHYRCIKRFLPMLGGTNAIVYFIAKSDVDLSELVTRKLTLLVYW